MSKGRDRNLSREKATQRIALVAGLLSLLPLRAFAEFALPIELHTHKTHSRLVLKADPSAEPEWKHTQDGFEILFKGMGLVDLGIPLGIEPQILEQIGKLPQKSRDPRLAALTISETDTGLKFVGKWKYPKGDQAPATPMMEKFDYRQKEPARFVVDFWHKKGLTVAEARSAKLRADQLEAQRKAEDDSRRRSARRLASDKARSEAEDLSKFCKWPLSEKTDIFLPFKPVHQPVDFTQWISGTTPDSHFPYFEPPAEGNESQKDAQYVRLALSLYKQGKPALVIRTLDFFEKEHPKSPYRHEMSFLRANALIRLGHQEPALQILKKLMAESKDQPVALYSGMFVATKSMNEGSSLAALDGFLWLINNHPGHRLSWVFHLGAAEAMYTLKQTERAAKEYQWVTEKAPDAKAQAHGALRMGDLYLERKEYDRALASYFQGLNYFKSEAKEFAPIHLNRAESLYFLSEFGRAQEAFEAFLKDFPSHPEGWRATLRLGEIHGRREGDKPLADSRKYLYETINRFPFSPGATLARARLLPCGDHAGFNLEAAERFFAQEAIRFEDTPGAARDLFLDRYREYISLARVRTLITLGSEEKAVSIALEEFHSHSHSPARKMLAGTLRAVFRKALLTMLDDGRRYEALRFYREKIKNMPEDDDGSGLQVDPDYLLRLSQAAADLGFGGFAAQLVKVYGAEVEKREKTRAPANVAEKKEIEEDLENRLKNAERGFTEAKALWIGLGVANDPDREARIREALDSVIDESPYSWQKEVIYGLLEERGNRPALALDHALKASVLMPRGKFAGQVADSLRLVHWVARLQARLGNHQTATQLYLEVEKYLVAKTQLDSTSSAAVLGVPPVPELQAILMTLGELHTKQGNWGDAAAVFARVESSQAKFEQARALLSAGDVASSDKGWEVLRSLADAKMAAGPQDFWKKLAREALESRKIETNNAKEGRK